MLTLERPPCDGQRDHANGARERTQPTVALHQSALGEVLDALEGAEVDDRIRQAAQTIYQALIEAELTSVIGAGLQQRTPDRLAQRNGHRPRVLATTCGRDLLQGQSQPPGGRPSRDGGHRGVRARPRDPERRPANPRQWPQTSSAAAPRSAARSSSSLSRIRRRCWSILLACPEARRCLAMARRRQDLDGSPIGWRCSAVIV
jgi:Transposase, Mutator family